MILALKNKTIKLEYLFSSTYIYHHIKNIEYLFYNPDLRACTLFSCKQRHISTATVKKGLLEEKGRRKNVVQQILQSKNT